VIPVTRGWRRLTSILLEESDQHGLIDSRNDGGVRSLRREKEIYKAMSNHAGTIWNNTPNQVHRRTGPGTNYALIDSLSPGQQLIVLCYSLGETETFTAPNGQAYTSAAWDFVVTSDQDPGGYVADVFIDTGGDITQQFGQQGICDQLKQRLV